MDDQHHVYLFPTLETDSDSIATDLSDIGTPVSGKVVDFIGIHTE